MDDNDNRVGEGAGGPMPGGASYDPYAAQFQPPAKPQSKLWPAVIIIASTAVLIAAALFVVLCNPFTDPKENALHSLFGYLQKENYEDAYNKCFTDDFRSGTSLDAFKQKMSGMSFYKGIEKTTVLSNKDQYEVLYDCKVDGKPMRAYLSVTGLGNGESIKGIDLLEIDGAEYGTTVETYSSDVSGDDVYLVHFRCFTDYSENKDFSGYVLLLGSKELAHAGIIEFTTMNGGAKSYSIYFSVPSADIAQDLSFKFGDYPGISLRDLQTPAQPK